MLMPLQIWSTAQKASFKTAVLMWPGPPILADGTAPTYHVPFKNHIDPSLKAAQIATWLDLPFEDRPNLIVAYAPEVDQEGHRSGPDSSKSDYELTHVDEFIKSVREVLQERSLEDYVDLVVVSDHGMTSTHNERLVFLDDILGEEGWKGVASNEGTSDFSPSLRDFIDEESIGWPSSGLRFKEHINETLMLEKLIDASQSSKGGFHVYTPSTMPSRWHFTGNEVLPLLGSPPLYGTDQEIGGG
jgi:predicted AlkP superfamily pyrophosphatase or phosphodiesterase